MNNSSGVGVLDKTISVLSALESGPASLAQLVKATGLARPTAHRIAVALETHRMLARDAQNPDPGCRSVAESNRNIGHSRTGSRETISLCCPGPSCPGTVATAKP